MFSRAQFDDSEAIYLKAHSRRSCSISGAEAGNDQHSPNWSWSYWIFHRHLGNSEPIGLETTVNGGRVVPHNVHGGVSAVAI